MHNRLLSILLIILVLIVCVACDSQEAKPSLEDNVREYLGTPTATLTLVTTDEPAWLDYTYTQYVMVNNGHTYLVGVQHEGVTVHYVDIEEEL